MIVRIVLSLILLLPITSWSLPQQRSLPANLFEKKPTARWNSSQPIFAHQNIISIAPTKKTPVVPQIPTSSEPSTEIPLTTQESPRSPNEITSSEEFGLPSDFEEYSYEMDTEAETEKLR